MHALTRHQAAALMLAAPLAATSTMASAAPAPVMPKALFFDVFGTCVDWRTGVAREAERILKPRGVNLNWLEFADYWRSLYQPSMDEVRTGKRPFVKLDVLHREMLDKTLVKYEVKGVPPDVLADLNLACHR